MDGALLDPIWDSPDETTFPGYSFLWDSATLIPHSKGLKCSLIHSNPLLSWGDHCPAKREILKSLVYTQVSPLGSPFTLYDLVTVTNPDAPKVD